MKLLLDENLSYRLVRLIEDIFPGSEQVKRLGLLGNTDTVIWEYAAQHGFCILTQDEDYAELSALRGAPPLVLLLRRGNQPTAAIAALLRQHQPAILATFLAPDSAIRCLTL